MVGTKKNPTIKCKDLEIYCEEPTIQCDDPASIELFPSSVLDQPSQELPSQHVRINLVFLTVLFKIHISLHTEYLVSCSKKTNEISSGNIISNI